jgi:glycosyltransferase involved in cell wall biosynthesis
MNLLTSDTANQRQYKVLRLASVSAAQVELSVIIPNFNTAEYVVAAIRSVLEQTFRNLEVIVVDDGSSDNSIETILSITDERLTCVWQPNRGLSGARNTGILMARGKFIGLLDSDDIWFPEKAARHLAEMANNSKVGVTFSYSAYLDESGSPTGQLLISRCKMPTIEDLVARNHVGNGSTPILRKDCVDMAGGFDESLKSCEEWELWVRLAVHTRCHFQLIPAVLTGYRVRQGSLSVTYEHFIRNGELAVDRFRDYVPGFSDAKARRAKSQNCRIASRKALSSGQTTLSRTLLFKALRQYPAIVLRDPRAAGLVLMHLAFLLLPNAWRLEFYNAVRRVMRSVYSRWASVPPIPLQVTPKCSE